MTSRLDTDGYEIVDLSLDGKKTTVKIHREMMKAFRPRSDADDVLVDHKDGDRAMNVLGNLKWATVSMNNLNRHTVLGESGVLGVRFKGDKPRPNPWQAYARIEGRFRSLGHFPTKLEAETVRDNYTIEAVSHAA